MSFAAGYGGSFKMGANTFAVEEWTMNRKNRLDETTNSGSAGNATYTKTVREADGTVNIVWDAALTPETGGIDDGDSGTAEFQLGASALKYAAFPIIIESIALKVDNKQGVIRYTCNWKSNGAIPDPT